MDIKGLLEQYRKLSTNTEDFKNKIMPLNELVSRLSVVNDIMLKCRNTTLSLPNDYGVKELRDKIEDTLIWLKDFDYNNIQEVLK